MNNRITKVNSFALLWICNSLWFVEISANDVDGYCTMPPLNYVMKNPVSKSKWSAGTEFQP